MTFHTCYEERIAFKMHSVEQTEWRFGGHSSRLDGPMKLDQTADAMLCSAAVSYLFEILNKNPFAF